MSEYDGTTGPRQLSVTERQLRRLVVAAACAFHPRKRIDVIHEPDVVLLRGVSE
ncbi:hypothetical protein [Nocardioides jensenii]|uniref:hypothetical protein n=1 Tax=Nocardioides jensenii TaxID=1843 RepID=UPI000A57A18C|nr:hypothetical protein [Nocardioides jensenii]